MLASELAIFSAKHSYVVEKFVIYLCFLWWLAWISSWIDWQKFIMNQ